MRGNTTNADVVLPGQARFSRRIANSILLCLMVATSGVNPVSAQAPYPSKPIRLVVPLPPGGGVDNLARILADRLAAPLGQPVVIENRPGANGMIGAEAVARAAPDGYTMMVISNAFAIAPVALANVPVDVFRDFDPVIKAASNPILLVAHPSLKASTVQEFIAAARSAPGGLSYSSIGTGSPHHIAGELLKRQAKVEMIHIGYKGAAQAVTDVLGGQVKAMFMGLGAVAPHMKTGKLIAIAVTDRQRTPLLPLVPTLSEGGVTGADVEGWIGVFVPAKTPQAAVLRLNREFNAVLKLPEVRERLTVGGFDALGGSPEELAAAMRSDFSRYGKIVTEAGIKLD
jgi:tripartite-type tricarboxylate transporter receptor subunit TctC